MWCVQCSLCRAIIMWNGMWGFLVLFFFSFCPSYGCNTQVSEVFRLFHFSGLCWINVPGGAVLAPFVSCHNVHTIMQSHPSAVVLSWFVVLSSKTVWLILLQCIAGGFLLASCPVAPKSLLNLARVSLCISSSLSFPFPVIYWFPFWTVLPFRWSTQ